MESFPKSLTEKLQQCEAENALRTPGSTGQLIDFSSNDYLGLAGSEELFITAHELLLGMGVKQNGATGSRLISGNHALYDDAEKAIAEYHEAESALVFNSGYDANVGFFSCVPQKGDIVLYDEAIHASVRDGLKLSGAASFKFAHNDKEALYRLVERHRSKAQELYIVTESVFSMDGDTPNLEAFADIAQRYKCRLVVDEAHAIGVFGRRGQGLLQDYGLQQRVFATVITFGKALGCHGAAILGSKELTTYLANFARSFVFTTALPPHSLAAIISSYNLMRMHPENTAALQQVIAQFKNDAERCRLPFIISFSAIQCIVVPGNDRARRIAALLQRAGFSVKAILSPTVPAGQERLRICLHNFNTTRQISALMDTLTNALRYS